MYLDRSLYLLNAKFLFFDKKLQTFFICGWIMQSCYFFGQLRYECEYSSPENKNLHFLLINIIRFALQMQLF